MTKRGERDNIVLKRYQNDIKKNGGDGMERPVEEIKIEEKQLKAINGLVFILIDITVMLLATGNFIVVVSSPSVAYTDEVYFICSIVLFVACMIICPILFCGVKILSPNEALVLTLFGEYHGTLRGPGMFYVNPFCVAVNPAVDSVSKKQEEENVTMGHISLNWNKNVTRASKKISLKNMTLNNDKQKINDLLGNPIIIGIVVIWRIKNTAKAVFNVDNYKEFLSIQCDSALRDVVRLYPYDVSADGEEKSLRGSSQEVAEKLKAVIQERVEVGGMEIIEARITHLSYAQEIAAAMLQRQQAAAVIDARKAIVEGAVGMVDMALQQLSEGNIVELDEERKAAMVSNLLVVLCASKDAQPIVNSGSLY